MLYHGDGSCGTIWSVGADAKGASPQTTRTVPLVQLEGDIMNRLILMKGGVETLTFFSSQIGKYFASKGYSIFWFDLSDAISSAKHLKKFIKQGETVLITFNFLGVSVEDYIYDDD